MEQIGREEGESESQQSRIEGRSPRLPDRQREEGEYPQAAVSGQFQESVPGHRRGVAVVLAEGVDEDGSDDGSVLLEEGVAEPVDQTGSEVGEEIAGESCQEKEGNPIPVGGAADEADG